MVLLLSLLFTVCCFIGVLVMNAAQSDGTWPAASSCDCARSGSCSVGVWAAISVDPLSFARLEGSLLITDSSTLTAVTCSVPWCSVIGLQTTYVRAPTFLRVKLFGKQTLMN